MNDTVGSLLYIIGLLIMYGAIIYFLIWIIRNIKKLDNQVKELTRKIENPNNNSD
jgi:uncharacterized protein YoxC